MCKCRCEYTGVICKKCNFFQHNGGTLELAGRCAPIIPCALIADPGREVFESADAPASLKSDAWKHFGFKKLKNEKL